MPRGDKRKYTDKEKRQAEHIEEGYEDRGLPMREAKRRAWATVNKVHKGGEKPGGGGYGKAPARPPPPLSGPPPPEKRPPAKPPLPERPALDEVSHDPQTQLRKIPSLLPQDRPAHPQTSKPRHVRLPRRRGKA